MNVLKFVKITKNATTPVKGSPMAAKYDLCSAAEINILPHSQAVVPRDLKSYLPPGTYGRIAPPFGSGC